jgi:hypothetical protein
MLGLALQLVDEIVYFVGKIDAAPRRHQLGLSIGEKIGNRADVRAIETRSVTQGRHAAEHTAQ